jgi:hypothetical protein
MNEDEHERYNLEKVNRITNLLKTIGGRKPKKNISGENSSKLVSK